MYDEYMYTELSFKNLLIIYIPYPPLFSQCIIGEHWGPDNIDLLT